MLLWLVYQSHKEKAYEWVDCEFLVFSFFSPANLDAPIIIPERLRELLHHSSSFIQHYLLKIGNLMYTNSNLLKIIQRLPIA